MICFVTRSSVTPGVGPKNMKKKPRKTKETQARLLKKVEITVKTYPDLQPFLEMAVLLLEGVYEHMAEVARTGGTK